MKLLVHVEYAQDWLTEPLETTGQKQASWRSDPSRSGIGGCISDIGTHAFNLLSFITGLKTNSLCADMSSFGPDRLLDDNVNMLLRFEGGARGMLWASQVAPGNENHLGIRIYGDKGGGRMATGKSEPALVYPLWCSQAVANARRSRCVARI